MASRVFARLPPVWAVVALLVGRTITQALLALPVAAAEFGAWPSLGLLAVIGLLMALSIAAQTEALVRDGEFRRGGFFGTFVAHYLGTRAASIPTALAGLRTGMSVLAGYIGICVTLASLTGAPRVLWGALTIVLLTIVLVRGGVRTPAAAGALIGLACLPLLAVISVIALFHGHAHNLGAAHGVSSGAFSQLLGIVLILYMGSVYVVHVARDMLPRDPDGRALIAGSAVATLATTAIAAGWLLTTASALPPAQLHNEVGTVLGPLAQRAGPAVTVFGVVLTVLLLGLGTQRASVALMDLVDEWMPSRRAIPVLAPIVICLLGELLLDLGEASFSGVFNAAGIATNVVLGLALPVLLLRVSRRTGDLTPGLVVPLLGRRPVAVGLLLADAALLVALMSALGDDRLLRVVAFLALVALVALVWLSREPRRKTSDAAPVFADAPHEG